MWRIGVDEAGYGPNFGPLVMTAVACRVPDDRADADLWKLLRSAVCRCPQGKKPRLLVDDSKKVYRSGQGLGELECTTLAFVTSEEGWPTSLEHLLARLGVSSQALTEPWYCGSSRLPHAVAAERLSQASGLLDRTCRRAEVTRITCHSRLVCAPRFNDLVDRYDSKGAVLGVTLLELLAACLAQEPAENVVVAVDKHGGRNHYGPLLQELAPDVWVIPRVEGMRESRYDVMLPGGRAMTVTFRPEADATSFEVALASVVSKYVRELCMAEFNAFWHARVPDLVPTAGYPGDASRFLEAIRPTLERLDIPIETLWRKR